jgi:hypothetical protein
MLPPESPGGVGDVRVAAAGRPRLVSIALALLWLALALMIVGSVVYVARSAGAVPLSDIGTTCLGYALVTLVMRGIARGVAWARTMLLIVLAWSGGLLAINLVLQSRHLLGLAIFDICAMALQLIAAVLLFRAASEPWFQADRPLAAAR